MEELSKWELFKLRVNYAFYGIRFLKKRQDRIYQEAVDALYEAVGKHFPETDERLMCGEDNVLAESLIEALVDAGVIK